MDFVVLPHGVEASVTEHQLALGGVALEVSLDDIRAEPAFTFSRGAVAAGTWQH